MALFRKNTFSSKSENVRQQIIKVDPYENPENVLELMAKICSAVPSANDDFFWKVINDAYNYEVKGVSLATYLKDNRNSLFEQDFDHHIKDYCEELAFALDSRENTEHTQVVVAGGFSSGKSSFLNRLTNSHNLLPTGVEPISVVKTYLYCSSKNKSVSVRGVNQKNVLVTLDNGVLQAIQHAKQSTIYLASVLDKLFVEIPSKNLDGLVFIDTPGYNNSDKANKSNGKTDKETTQEALGEGNVLFWLVDCERGTTVTADIEMIKQFQGKKKVFIFNKADKKGKAESKKIIEQAAQTLYSEFPKEEIIDILAFSTLDNEIYYSFNNMTLNSIIIAVKATGNGNTQCDLFRYYIDALFEDEITASSDTIEQISNDYKKKVELKSKYQKAYQNAKEYKDYIANKTSDMLIQSYNEVLNAANNLSESGLNSLNTFYDFLNAMYIWDNTDHQCLTNTLRPKIDCYNNAYERLCNKHNSAIKYKYYNEDYRKEIVKRIVDEEEELVGEYKEWYDEACEECNNALTNKSSEESKINAMTEYRKNFMKEIDSAIKEYRQKNKATDITTTPNEIPNVFDCIRNDNYKQFLRSFENGVDLNACNAEGYNPLTYSVFMGNNMMVQFMLNQDADPSIKDRRGYNALHTAVENQYRDICKVLLDADPELINSKTSKGETIEQLASKDSFKNYIKDEIYKAY